MTVRVDIDALMVLRAAASLADLDGPAAQGLRRAMALTDPTLLRALEEAEEDEPARESVGNVISSLVH